MVGLVRLLLVLWPLAELVLLVAFAQWFGIGWMLLALLGGVVAGGLVIRVLGAASLAELGQALARREPPAGALVRGACVLLAGMLLILPGFIGDLLALLLLAPPLRGVLLRALWRNTRRAGGGTTIIEGEYRAMHVERNQPQIDNRIEDHEPRP